MVAPSAFPYFPHCLANTTPTGSFCRLMILVWFCIWFHLTWAISVKTQLRPWKKIKLKKINCVSTEMMKKLVLFKCGLGAWRAFFLFHLNDILILLKMGFHYILTKSHDTLRSHLFYWSVFSSPSLLFYAL